MRGKLVIGEHTACSGMRLSTILKLIPRIEPAKLVQNIPEGNFTLGEGFAELEGFLSNLLGLCRLARRKKQLGFLALHTDGQGSYWFNGTRNYLTALRESLYSLEPLADERRGRSAEINRVYRELGRELETL